MATPSSTITRFDLSSTFSEFEVAAARQGFIGAKVFRPRLVPLQSADVGKLPIEQVLQDHDTSRARGAGYKRGHFEFETWSYKTEEAGWEEPVDERDRALYSDILDAEMVAGERALDFVLRKYERVAASTLYDTATWTGAALTTAITHEWDDHTNAVPITNIQNARQKIIDGCGLVPNALILNAKQLWHLTQCDQIVSLVKYTVNPFEMQIQAFANALQIPMLIVAGWNNIHNTANEAQTASLSAVWSDEYMMLAKVATSDDPREPCIGRTFVWSGDGVGAPGTGEQMPVVMEEYYSNEVRSDIYRVRTEYGFKVMYPQAAHLISNAIEI
jgi:hypothetical protein